MQSSVSITDLMTGNNPTDKQSNYATILMQLCCNDPVSRVVGGWVILTGWGGKHGCNKMNNVCIPSAAALTRLGVSWLLMVRFTLNHENPV
jgi:hypothetical protein